MDLLKSLRMTYSGAEFRHSLAPALVHLFNHQTHHRGQLNAPHPRRHRRGGLLSNARLRSFSRAR